MARDWSKEPDLLPRKHAVSFLGDLGFPITERTLMQMAYDGSKGKEPGPPFVIFGNKALYRQVELRSWAEGRLKYRGGPSLAQKAST